MKKSLLTFLLFLMVIPFEVNAKEYCKVVDGDGKSIGSEIACGSEHFYIIESNEDEIKMLAKYNLYTGVSIYKEKIEKEEGDTRSDAKYCSDLAASKGGTVKSDGFYNNPGYCFYTVINSKVRSFNETIIADDDTRSAEEICMELVNQKQGTYKSSSILTYPYQRLISCSYSMEYLDYNLLQNEDAKSAHWDDELNYLYPQIGDVYMLHTGSVSEMHYEDGLEKNENPIRDGSSFYDFSIDFNGLDETIIDSTLNSGSASGIRTPLYVYKHLLSEMGFTVHNISLLSLSELDDIINKIGNNSLPLQEWEDNFDVIQTFSQYNTEIHFGDLKPYIPKQYSWLYSTTYWNSSIFQKPNNNTFYNTYFVFTAQQGKLCGAGFGTCAPQTTLGCGIRPVITIPNELQYLISTKTDENGTIDAVENSLGGESIQFKVTAKKGYKLGGIIIRTNSDEQVEFSEGEIIKNEDGSYSIDKNQFTMPFENVTIEAKWVPDSIVSIPDTLKNLQTSDKLIIISLLMIAGLGIGSLVYKRKESR